MPILHTAANEAVSQGGWTVASIYLPRLLRLRGERRGEEAASDHAK